LLMRRLVFRPFDVLNDDRTHRSGTQIPRCETGARRFIRSPLGGPSASCRQPIQDHGTRMPILWFTSHRRPTDHSFIFSLRCRNCRDDFRNSNVWRQHETCRGWPMADRMRTAIAHRNGTPEYPDESPCTIPEDRGSEGYFRNLRSPSNSESSHHRFRCVVVTIVLPEATHGLPECLDRKSLI